MALRSISAEGYFFRWGQGAVTILYSADGDVGKDVQRRAYAVQKRMKRNAGFNTGVLRRGITVESVRETPGGGPKAAVISSAPHTMVHELGRGPVRVSAGRMPKKIRAGESRPALRFQPKRGMRSIYRFEVKAAAGTHFMERSVDAALD